MKYLYKKCGSVTLVTNSCLDYEGCIVRGECPRDETRQGNAGDSVSSHKSRRRTNKIYKILTMKVLTFLLHQNHLRLLLLAF